VTDPDAIFVLMSMEEFDDEGHPLYWSNTEGWTTVDQATRFTEEESRQLNQPVDSYWAELALDTSDKDAMDAIHRLLDGREWSPDTLDEIANIVRQTGREVRDSGELDCAYPNCHQQAVRQVRDRMLCPLHADEYEQLP
jgi:hypothetical protein